MNEQERQALDQANAAERLAIAERLEAAYLACLKHCINCFGPGWIPSHRHDLIEKDEMERVRYTPEHPVVFASVYTARCGDQRRHFVLDAYGVPREVASMEAGFGDLLLAPHPTRTITVLGKQVSPHRFDLCWRGYELYRPKSAEQLAALRTSRRAKKDERARKKWAEENPLLVYGGVAYPEEESS